MDFKTTVINVLLLVSMAIPGYIAIKTKLLKSDAIQVLAKVLMFLNQPFLTLNSFLKSKYIPGSLKNLGIVTGVTFGIQILMLVLLVLNCHHGYNKKSPKKIEGFLQTINDDFFLIDKKKVERGKRLRVLTTCSVFGNVGFLGIPVLNALLPSHPEAVTYAAIFIVAMNFLSWTVGIYIITGEKKFISLKKAIFNPPTITLVLALPLFFCRVELPQPVLKTVAFMSDMTTPMCMLILGMRFAVAPLKEMFTNVGVYIATFTKNFIFPLITYAIVSFLPIDASIKISIFILSAMPCASVNLNLSEIYGGDRKTAANTILFSTLFCCLSIPILMLLATFLK